MASLWDANKGKSDTKSLPQNLNYLNKLTSQLDYLRDPGDRPVRIAYTAGGRLTAALIGDATAILDTKLYQVSCAGMDEAHYLLALINSVTLESQVAPFRAKGLYGERDRHKHLWKLPILTFNPDDAGHASLAALGQRAVGEASAVIGDLDNPTAGRARAAMRHQWQLSSPTAQAIEKAVAQLLLPPPAAPGNGTDGGAGPEERNHGLCQD